MCEFLFDHEFRDAKLVVVGIGGGGTNAVNYMVEQGLPVAITVAANTDKQQLDNVKADYKIQIGRSLTQGLGAGGNPEVGFKAMEESKEELRTIIEDADMVFLTAGLGGGTGTGGIQVAAELCRELNILSVAVVTLPFHFEGESKMEIAKEWLAKLEGRVDTLLVIPNQKLYQLYSDIGVYNAFPKANEVLFNAVNSIVGIIVDVGMVNVDFADVRTIMSEPGRSIMGAGEGFDEDRALKAAKSAINSPLLDGVSIAGAKGILLNFTIDRSFKLCELERSSNYILKEAQKGGTKPKLIFGAVLDDSLNGKVKLTVIATGIDSAPEPISTQYPTIEKDIFGDPAIKIAKRRSKTKSFRERKLYGE